MYKYMMYKYMMYKYSKIIKPLNSMHPYVHHRPYIAITVCTGELHVAAIEAGPAHKKHTQYDTMVVHHNGDNMM